MCLVLSVYVCMNMRLYLIEFMSRTGLQDRRRSDRSRNSCLITRRTPCVCLLAVVSVCLRLRAYEPEPESGPEPEPGECVCMCVRVRECVSE